ncbi:MAG: hypothetical protein CAPSK01_001621 [Candidatus Accumulibacter vicinus]|uniref:Uncharacterized protein n=1 Tax=Candidatus Accumulibacter vicinus TaxID=2954382 RepID=A0A084Y223_9PROT|nr:MAG: hypothetical protein CAPSK01_001621 [Candidatus Accumulibacter vicinus]
MLSTSTSANAGTLASASSPASNTVRPGRVGGGVRSFLVQDGFDRCDLGGGAGRSSRASHATSARPTGEFCKRLIIDSLLTCMTSMNEWDHLQVSAWARQARVIVKHRAFEAWLARRRSPSPPAHRNFAPLRHSCQSTLCRTTKQLPCHPVRPSLVPGDHARPDCCPSASARLA